MDWVGSSHHHKNLRLNHVAEQSFWLRLPSCSLPKFRFPINLCLSTLVGTLLCCDWHLDHSGYSGTSLPTDEPNPVATIWTPEMDWPECPYWARKKRVSLTSLLLPSLFLLLNLPYPTGFSCPLVLDSGTWLKSLSLSWGFKTDHLVLTESSNSGSGLFWILVGLSSSPSFLEA